MIGIVAGCLAAALALAQDEGRAAAPSKAPPTLAQRGEATLARANAEGFPAATADVLAFCTSVTDANAAGPSRDETVAKTLDALLALQLEQTDDLQNHELLASLAFALGMIGFGDRGMTPLEAAAAQPTPTFHVLLATGTVRMARREVASALTLFERASKLRPDDPAPWYDRGSALGVLQRYPDALVAFDEAKRLAPDDVGVGFNRALVLEKLQRADDALAAYGPLADGESPYAARAALNAGTILVKRGDRDGALARFQRCVALAPDNAPGCYNLGALLVELGRDDDAKPHLAHAIQLRPKDARPHALLGQIADDADDAKTAEAEFRAALALDAKHQAARFRLAQLLRRTGRADEAKGFEDKP